MKHRDWIIIAVLLAIAAGLYAGNRMMAGKAGNVFTVTVDGQIVLEKLLSTDAVYPIRQEDGSVNLIEVKNGAVSMREANCRDGLCMRQGATRSPAKNIVCLPHKLVVSVLREDNGRQEELDVIVQ